MHLKVFIIPLRKEKSSFLYQINELKNFKQKFEIPMNSLKVHQISLKGKIYSLYLFRGTNKTNCNLSFQKVKHCWEWEEGICNTTEVVPQSRNGKALNKVMDSNNAFKVHKVNQSIFMYGIIYSL